MLVLQPFFALNFMQYIAKFIGYQCFIFIQLTNYIVNTASLQLCYTGDELPNDYFNFVLYTYIQF